MSLKSKSYFLMLTLGAVLILYSVLPLVFAFPYSDSTNSGPSNVWELIVMISNEGWVWFLIIGLVLSLFSVLKLRRK